MKRNCLTVLLLTSFMLLLSLDAFALHTGNVDVKFKALDNTNQIYYGQTNIFQIWITNDGALGGMTMGFGFAGTSNYSWVSGYGGFPPAGTITNIIKEEGDAVGKFDLGGLMVTTTSIHLGSNADSILIGGAAIAAKLPVHAASALCYSASLSMPSTGQPDDNSGFCVRPIFFPPAGSWVFNDGVGYPPTFMSNSVGTSGDPQVAPACFKTMTLPCLVPVFTSTPGAAVSHNHCTPFTFTFAATEGGNQPAANPVTFSASAGTINPTSGAFSIDPNAHCGTTDVVVTATNGCGSSATYPFTVTWTNNNPAITNCPAPGNIQKVGMGNVYTLQLNTTDPDPCDGAVWSVAHTGGPAPVGTFGISGTGLFSFNTVNPTDGGNDYVFTATVTDPCGATATCEFTVRVLVTQPFIIKIEKTHLSFQGSYEYVSITKEAGSEQMGGFDFLVAYDASGISFMSASLGAALGPNGCQWEYFTYRFGANGNCSGPCPSGMLRVVAIADQNDGAHHPSCFTVANGTELVSLKFYVTSDANFECMYIPIQFAWMDCGDNGISSRTGDTLFISDQVFDFQNTNPLTDPNYNITGIGCGMIPTFGGYCDQSCLVGMKTFPLPFILFWNGGVDIACADSIDARGDINLNGIANEIADAVLYTNYFLYGVSVFDPARYQAARAASDVNADGRPLTVGDLVYLLRIVVGDALPYPKLAPFANTANVNVVNGQVSTEASTEIGAIYAIYTVNGAYTVTNNSGMELVSAENNGELKVLVYSGTTNMTNRIPAGNNNLFTVSGNVDLKSVEISDYNGAMLNTRVNKTALPTSFALSQNVPNPFNPSTKIGMDLPTASDWTINIYNVAGQLVKSFNGRGVGQISIEWDASNVPSGVYFYKATAGSFTDTKKMVLMK